MIGKTMRSALLAAAIVGGGAPVLAGEWHWSLPDYVPPPRIPADNPMTTEKVELGRRLFYDARLSGNGSLSCAGCHDQALAFTETRPVAVGSTGESTPRRAMRLANVGWNATYTWANPALVSLERQMEVPLYGDSPIEMGVNDANKPEILARLKTDASLAAAFHTAFPTDPEPISFANIIKAVASFERSLVSFDSRYDRYLQGKEALSEQEIRGKNLFFGEKAECHHCHGSFNFNDQVVHADSREVETPFHNTGLYNIDGQGGFPYPNRGVFELTGNPADMGAFRAQSLRNVAVTGPYMHDGSIATLEEVLDFYAAGGRNILTGPNAGDGRLNPHKSDLVVSISLNEQDKKDLIAFLKTLTDQAFLKNPNYSKDGRKPTSP